MASKIISVEKSTVPAGKRNAGQVFYRINCFVGSMLNPRQAQRFVFLTGNAVIDKEVTDYWDGVIASKAFPAIDLRYVTVGDRESNPNAIPLPQYRTKNDDGTVGNSVHTTMQVLMQYEDGKMIGSPRSQAMRIIESLCELVTVSGEAPVMDEAPVM